MYFDVQGKRAFASTGGKPFFDDRTGFDFTLKRIYICKGFKSGGASGSVCAGDMPKQKFTLFFSDIKPQRWNGAKKRFEDIHRFTW